MIVDVHTHTPRYRERPPEGTGGQACQDDAACPAGQVCQRQRDGGGNAVGDGVCGPPVARGGTDV